MTRLVLLGASNIRRGLSAIVGTARAALEGPMAILGAFGHGRSYGKRSCIPFRCLPGILECGIWKALSEESESPALVLVADVGNDILYGESAATILGWVSECVGRFATARITIAGLPLPRLRALNRGRFLFFRSILFPSSRHSRDTVISAAEELDDGLRRLATSARARFVEPDPAWYGADPIHIRRRCFSPAWSTMLGLEARPFRLSVLGALRLRLAAPERRWICGIERRRKQPAFIDVDGTRVGLY